MVVRRDIKQEAEDAVANGVVGSVWEYIHGTAQEGNLPQHKKHLHEGHCWAPCPYSTQCNPVRREIMIGTNSPTEGINDHSYDGKVHYMETHSKGSVWGFECTSDNCPYYVSTGKRYFHT